MSALLERLLEEAKQLTPEERLSLGEELLAESDPGAERAWDEEIACRVEEIKSGKVKMIPFDEVMAKLRAKHG
jgi:putative addiction module component (TIGR02574 family)